MKYFDLLKTELKSDVLCDLFQAYDVQVIYEYDRSGENLPDEYHAEIPELGLQFVFDYKQVLRTLFLIMTDVSVQNPLDGEDERIRKFTSKSEALSYAVANDIRSSEGTAEFMGEQKEWVRFASDTYSIHYEYVDSELRMITLQVVNS